VVERQVIALSLAWPSGGPQQLSSQLARKGLRVLSDQGGEFEGAFDESCCGLGIRDTCTKPRHAFTLLPPLARMRERRAGRREGVDPPRLGDLPSFPLRERRR
jgi:hypothetical protein